MFWTVIQRSNPYIELQNKISDLSKLFQLYYILLNLAYNYNSIFILKLQFL